VALTPLAHAFGAAWVAPDDALNVQGQRAIAALHNMMHSAASAGKSGGIGHFCCHHALNSS
jgi:hypothetical protein